MRLLRVLAVIPSVILLKSDRIYRSLQAGEAQRVPALPFDSGNMSLNIADVLNDKDGLIDLGLHHVKRLRAERDLARSQLIDVQKASTSFVLEHL